MSELLKKMRTSKILFSLTGMLLKIKCTKPILQFAGDLLLN